MDFIKTEFNGITIYRSPQNKNTIVPFFNSSVCPQGTQILVSQQPADNEEHSYSIVSRSPQNDNTPVPVFNSSECLQDKQIVVSQQPEDNEESHSHSSVFKPDRHIVNNPPDTKSLIRRSFLNDCIRYIYSYNDVDDYVPIPQGPSEFDHEKIWLMVDKCLKTNLMSPAHEKMFYVKRQLFRGRKRSRKMARPRKAKMWGTQLLNFRPMRRIIGHHRIRRNLTRNCFQLAMSALIRENIPRIYTTLSGGFYTWSPGIHTYLPCIVDGNGIYSTSSNTLTKILNYHNNKAKHHRFIEGKLPWYQMSARYEEGCNLLRRAMHLEAIFVHEQACMSSKSYKIPEGRSMDCTRELCRLIQDHEEYVRQDAIKLARFGATALFATMPKPKDFNQ